jgi:hypothetical protein
MVLVTVRWYLLYGPPCRFGRNQQTNPHKAITTSHGAVAATPLDDPG